MLPSDLPTPADEPGAPAVPATAPDGAPHERQPPDADAATGLWSTAADDVAPPQPGEPHADREAPPADREPLAGDREAPPADRESRTVDRDPTTVDRGARTVDRNLTTVDRRATSAAPPLPSDARQAASADAGPRLKALFPALFAGAPKPLKLRIQLDIQARAPGSFSTNCQPP
jgi:hypothetical protein